MYATIARTGLACTAAAAALLLAGCNDIERALNRGGDTPCKDYVQQDPDTKRMTITKFIKQNSGIDSEAGGHCRGRHDHPGRSAVRRATQRRYPDQERRRGRDLHQ